MQLSAVCMPIIRFSVYNTQLMCILAWSDELSVVFSTQRATDELLLNVSSLTIDSSAVFLVAQLTARLNATRQRCLDNDYTSDAAETLASVCRVCWLGYSEIIATSLALVWSFAGRTIQMRQPLTYDNAECKQLALQLTQFEDLVSANEQTGLNTHLT